MNNKFLDVSDKEARETPISMGFLECYSRGFINYFNFDDRASRAEYWYFWLGNLLMSFIFLGLTIGFGYVGELLDTLFSLGIIIPSLAVSFRRIHDIGKSGWWVVSPYIAAFVTALGYIPIMVLETATGTNLSLYASIVLIAGGFTVFVLSMYLLVLALIKGDAKTNKYGAPRY